MSKKYFENKSLKLHFFQGWDRSQGICESQDQGSDFLKPEQNFPCVLYEIGEDEPAIPDATKWKVSSNIGYTFETPDFDQVSVVFKDGKPDDFFAGDIDDYKRTLKRLMDKKRKREQSERSKLQVYKGPIDTHFTEFLDEGSKSIVPGKEDSMVDAVRSIFFILPQVGYCLN